MSNPIWGGATGYGGVVVSENQLLDAARTLFAMSAPGRPDVILCGRANYAAIKAHIDFQGRDRRRIKREVNKAMRKARRL